MFAGMSQSSCLVLLKNYIECLEAENESLFLRACEAELEVGRRDGNDEEQNRSARETIRKEFEERREEEDVPAAEVEEEEAESYEGEVKATIEEMLSELSKEQFEVAKLRGIAEAARRTIKRWSRRQSERQMKVEEARGAEEFEGKGATKTRGSGGEGRVLRLEEEIEELRDTMKIEREWARRREQERDRLVRSLEEQLARLQELKDSDGHDEQSSSSWGTALRLQSEIDMLVEQLEQEVQDVGGGDMTMRAGTGDVFLPVPPGRRGPPAA
eukprot:195843-Hanusia_phi.AAC.2